MMFFDSPTRSSRAWAALLCRSVGLQPTPTRTRLDRLGYEPAWAEGPYYRKGGARHTASWVALAATLLFANYARADDAWSLTTSDFKTESVVIQSIDATTVTATTPAGEARPVPISAFVQLVRDAHAKPPAGLVLCVAGGQRLIGTPRRIDGANLVWFTVGVGEVTVPLDSLLGVLRDRTAADGLNDARAEDTVRLGTGDTVHGILTDASDSAFVLTPSAGDPVKVVPAAVTSILFASPPGGRKPAPSPAFLVRVGGSVLAAETVALNGDGVHLTTAAGTAADVPLAQVDAIEHTRGAVSWLSSREPTASVQTSYLAGSFPAKMDTSVTGGPIRFGGVTYARGIGVHSRSKLTFALRPGDKTFRTRYAIDGNQPLADVDVALYLDGLRVQWKTGVKAGELSPLIELPLGDAKTLTLEVDYGRGYDVQDRLNWIEPAIVRETK